jgi:hypothetical protein
MREPVTPSVHLAERILNPAEFQTNNVSPPDERQIEKLTKVHSAFPQ